MSIPPPLPPATSTVHPFTPTPSHIQGLSLHPYPPPHLWSIPTPGYIQGTSLHPNPQPNASIPPATSRVHPYPYPQPHPGYIPTPTPSHIQGTSLPQPHPALDPATSMIHACPSHIHAYPQPHPGSTPTYLQPRPGSTPTYPQPHPGSTPPFLRPAVSIPGPPLTSHCSRHVFLSLPVQSLWSFFVALLMCTETAWFSWQPVKKGQTLQPEEAWLHVLASQLQAGQSPQLQTSWLGLHITNTDRLGLHTITAGRLGLHIATTGWLVSLHITTTGWLAGSPHHNYRQAG